MTSPLSRFGDRARQSAWAVWLTGGGVYFLALLHRASLGVAGPDAVDRLGITATQLGSFVMVQLGLYAVMQVPSGVAIDRWGPRRVLFVATLVLGTAQLAFAFATSYPVALAARGLLGIGDSAVFIAVLRLAAMWFPHHRYAVLTMLTGLVGMAGNLAATVPLVAALGWLGWTRTFAITAAASLVYALLLLRPAVAAPYRVAPAEVPAVPRRAVADVRAAWSRRETRLGFWTHQATMAPGVVISLVWGYPYLTAGLGYSDAAAASQLSIFVLGTLAMSFVVGPLAGRRPTWRSPMAIVVALLGIAGLAMLVLWPGGQPPHGAVTAAFVLLAIGGPGSQIGFHIARDYNAPVRISTATGLVNAGGFVGAMVAAIVVGRVLDLRSGAADPSLLDYRWAVASIGLIAVVSTLALVLTLLGVRADVLERMSRGERVVVPQTEHWWDRAYRRVTRRPPL